MAEPLREQIFAAIEQRLLTIAAGTVTIGSFDVTYYTTPLVVRDPLAITQYDQPLAPPATATQLDSKPVLGIVRGSGSTFSRITHVAPAGGPVLGFAHQMHFTIWGYVKATASERATTLLERLWSDHMNALLADPGLNTLVDDTRPDGPMDTDDGVLEPLAYFYQDWLVLAG